MTKLGKNKFELKREATYAKLIQAGFEVLCAKGYSGASVEDIVQHAGYTKGAFYVHFETKEQFMLDLLKYRRFSRSDLLEGLYTLTSQNKELESIIRILISQVVEHVSKTPEWILVYVDFFNQAKHNEKAMETYRAYYQEWVDAMRHFIGLLIEKHYISDDKNAEMIAKQFYAYLDGCLLHANLNQEPLNVDVMTQGFCALLR